MFSFWFTKTVSGLSDAGFSSQDDNSVSKPLRQSVGSLARLKGAQSCKQVSSSSAVTPQRPVSTVLCDCNNGSTSNKPTRVEKEAGSLSFQRPCFFKRTIVSSCDALSLSCCSSTAIWWWAFQYPRKAFSLYSNKRLYALFWVPHTLCNFSLNSVGFFESKVTSSWSVSCVELTSRGSSTKSVTLIRPSCRNRVSSVTVSHSEWSSALADISAQEISMRAMLPALHCKFLANHACLFINFSFSKTVNDLETWRKYIQPMKMLITKMWCHFLQNVKTNIGGQACSNWKRLAPIIPFEFRISQLISINICGMLSTKKFVFSR